MPDWRAQPAHEGDGKIEVVVHRAAEVEGMGYAIRAAGQPGPAGQGRIPAQAPGRATAARGATPLRQPQLSGAELEKAKASRGEGRVACG